MTTTARRTRAPESDSLSSAPCRSIPSVLHGTDPERGFPVTWHLSAVMTSGAGAPAVRIDRVEGATDNPDLWMQAHKESRVVSEAEAVAFVHAVESRPTSAR
ncbi:hypothetical protein GALL_331440 [mine drainage metagenome]|uniref:Uncharacterized protein n=1 Tax=mine drainage metagenome TaxID=410659 RepID=A0A1J5QZ64_9ZZZZ